MQAEIQQASAEVTRALAGTRRELAILHTTCEADMANQDDGKQAMYGFNVFGVFPRQDSRAYGASQINAIQ